MNSQPSNPDPELSQRGRRDIAGFSDDQLADALRAVADANAVVTVDRLQELVQELQVHRVELELQNRALEEAQSELEQSARRYADLYDHLPLPYLTVTLPGRIVQANLASAALFGLERTRLTGMSLARFLDPYDAGRLAGHLESCVNTGVQGTLELTLRLDGGACPTMQLSSRVAPEEKSQVLVAISDVTPLKQALRTLEEINREQEAFNYSISHDLRAPLITINNYSGIVLSDYGARMDAEARGMLERIRNAGVRMEHTLKHLLEYSTLAREDITIDVVDVNQVVKEVLIEHRALLQERSANVSVAPSLPAIRGCVPILNQVVSNLLTNALKYTRDGAAPVVRISAETRSRTVVLRVEDRGIGIDPKHHERIFRIFERLHGYSKYPGSGVGLAIARRAIERMQGRVWVESQPDQGSCFCVELPKA